MLIELNIKWSISYSKSVLDAAHIVVLNLSGFDVTAVVVVGREYG